MAHDVNLNINIHFFIHPRNGVEVALRDGDFDHAGSKSDAEIGVPEGGNSNPNVNKVDEMIERFEQFYSLTCARVVLNHMVFTGWTAYTPKPRGDRSQSSGTYIRLVYSGARRPVTLYLTSVALVSAGAAEREYMASRPRADPRTLREVYFHHKDNHPDRAIAAADALRMWADGQETPAA
jgi:hypothetical protein